MSCIFLIGMPAAGKSWWGKRIAETYNIPCVDLDEYIEHGEKATIPQLFEKYGETAFRDTETAALKKIIAGNTANVVVACGGGTAVFNDNMLLMKQAGCTIYLKATLETLASRIHMGEDVRPLINRSPFLLGSLQQMLNARENFYEQADHILQVENLSITNFAQIIASCIKQH